MLKPHEANGAAKEETILDIDLFGTESTAGAAKTTAARTGLDELDLLGLDGPKAPAAAKQLDLVGEIDLFAGIGNTSSNMLNTPITPQPQPQPPLVSDNKFSFDLLGGGPTTSTPAPAYTSPNSNFGTDLGFDLLGTSSPVLTTATPATQQKHSTLDTLDMLEATILSPSPSHAVHGGSTQKLDFLAMDDGNVTIRFHCTKVRLL